MRLTFAVLLLAVTFGCVHAADENRPTRFVALTIDDLPAQRDRSLAHVEALTQGILEQISTRRIPAVGFVNESKLYTNGDEELEARTALLQRWLDAGAQLGNHTYSHPDINSTPLEDYKQDVIRGETVTRRLMRAREMQLRYFRHPFLRTGNDPDTKAELERFLRERDYIVAPVTIDNDEWIYAAAYDRAAERGDERLMREIGSDSLRYMSECFAFSEDLAQQVLGREMKQILLIHANALNAEYLDELVAMIEGRGYRFVSLEEALRDEAYAQPDPYIGARGWSWLLRWGASKKLDTSKAPKIAPFVEELAGN